jgi:hypothetical protein
MPIHVISMVPSLQPKDYLELKASPQIQELREALRKFGGEPAFAIFLGDATVYSSKALGPADVGPFDMLVTKHPSIRAYNNATASDAYKMAEKKGKVLVFGFTNNGILVDLVFPALKSIFNLLQLGEVDFKTKASTQVKPKPKIPSNFPKEQAMPKPSTSWTLAKRWAVITISSAKVTSSAEK